MSLSPAQRHIAATIVQVGRRKGASRKEIVAALETARVESNFSNPAGGNGTSVGWRQETASSYPNANRRNVRAAARRFFSETAAAGGGKGKTAGQLAQTVQRSAFPGRYDQHRGEALSLYKNLGGKAGGGTTGAGSTSVSYVRPAVQTSGTDPAAILAGQLERPAPVQASAPPMPSFSARPALPAGFQAPPPVSIPEPKLGLSEQLQGLQGQGLGPEIQHPTVNVSQTGGGSGGKVVGHGHYPLARRGKVIGTPYSGTHTLGNWQSDNAVDVSVPVGTPVRAVEDGVITKTGGQAGSSGRFAGFSVTFGSKHNDYFYTHLKRRTVKPGQRVKKGQIIGYSGSANGVAHLHFGQRKGDPRNTVG
jgi:murein DD-endopeptidase MepM/ murein hydrolase activator NlpD